MQSAWMPKQVVVVGVLVSNKHTYNPYDDQSSG